MGDMTIRGLDEATLTTLRSRAQQHGMSAETYAATLLRGALAPLDEGIEPRGRTPAQGTNEREPVDIFAEASRIRAMTLKPCSIDSTELIRESRDEW
jgi:plasmid stability protein